MMIFVPRHQRFSFVVGSTRLSFSMDLSVTLNSFDDSLVKVRVSATYVQTGRTHEQQTFCLKLLFSSLLNMYLSLPNASRWSRVLSSLHIPHFAFLGLTANCDPDTCTYRQPQWRHFKFWWLCRCIVFVMIFVFYKFISCNISLSCTNIVCDRFTALIKMSSAKRRWFDVTLIPILNLPVSSWSLTIMMLHIRIQSSLCILSQLCIHMQSIQYWPCLYWMKFFFISPQTRMLFHFCIRYTSQLES